MPKFNKFLLLMVLMLSAMTAAVSQASMQAPLQPGTASLSGQIKIGGSGFPGAVVSLMGVAGQPGQANRPGGPPQPPAGQALTDAEGRYQIGNLIAGSYRISVSAPGYILSSSAQTIQVGEGQAVRSVDMTLAKGSVITGKVTGNGTRPLIGEPVTLIPVDDTGKPRQMRLPGSAMNSRTDDRGIYRIYGLPGGRYQLSVGRGDGRGPGNASSMWQRTFYPDATDPEGAQILALDEGQELTGIDINIASRNTYAIEGRVIDADTGSPIPGVLIGHTKTAASRNNRPNQPNNRQPQQQVIEQATDSSSNEAGEYRIEGLTAGKFTVYAVRDRSGISEYYSDPVPVDLASSDATGIEIRLKRGATIIGSVVFDNPADPRVQANLSNMVIRAVSRPDGQAARGGGGGAGGAITAQPGPNGAFKLSGLSPGLVTLTLVDRNARGGPSGLTLLRIERDGADVQAGLQVGPGEQVGRVRLIATYGNATLRGMVRIDGGTLPPQMRLSVTARRTDAGEVINDRGARNVPVDQSGRFQIDQLVAGTYEIRLQVPGAGRNATTPQTVTLVSGAVQNVILPLNVAELRAQPQRDNQRRPQGARP
ncbi:MAG: carboxypeptidase regulatory-like domain-containing protein [Acidobacteria bacterium]|nr:carboxypeptidase regulatory-like domain-containing protein [Acidobacteriota bacterium]